MHRRPLLLLVRTWVLSALLVGGSTAAFGQGKPAVISAEKLIENSVEEYNDSYADVEAAVELINKSDFSGAQAAFEECKKKHPELPPGGVLLAQVLFSLNQVPAARAGLERVVIEDPADPEAYLIFATLALAENQFTDAELLANRGLELAEKMTGNKKRQDHLQVVAHAALAKVWEARGDFKEAEKHLVAWTAMDPNKAEAQAALGRVLFQLKKTKEAAAALRSAAKADKNQPAWEVALGMLYESAGEHDSAATMMERAIAGYENNANVLTSVAHWEMQTDQLNKAKAHAEAAVKADPKLLSAKLVRAIIARYENDDKTARKHLEDAIVQAPFDFQSNNLLSQLLIESKERADQERALKYAQGNMQAYQNSAEAAATLGWIYHKLGRSAEADRLLQMVLASGKLTSESAFFVATMLDRNGRSEEARRLLEQSISKRFLYTDEAKALLAKLPKEKKNSKTK